ncbi:hypothetical protein ACFQ61_32415 [Streptomyces sp. NPDC056500]|uniref:hypothetical protein n=1 Tax=Streptomyces sp. NPDC056500 TaxID=3345840 RepID=UPI0036C50CF4
MRYLALKSSASLELRELVISRLLERLSGSEFTVHVYLISDYPWEETALEALATLPAPLGNAIGEAEVELDIHDETQMSAFTRIAPCSIGAEIWLDKEQALGAHDSGRSFFWRSDILPLSELGADDLPKGMSIIDAIESDDRK